MATLEGRDDSVNWSTATLSNVRHLHVFPSVSASVNRVHSLNGKCGGLERHALWTKVAPLTGADRVHTVEARCGALSAESTGRTRGSSAPNVEHRSCSSAPRAA